MSELSDDDIKQLASRLCAAQSDLEKQLKLGKEASSVVTLDQSKVGRVSRMDAMQQQQMALSTLAKTRQRLIRIKAALNAINTGDYGYCRRCDEEIGLPRLMAQPEAPLCISCQSLSDNQQ